MTNKFDIALSPEDVEEIVTILSKSNYQTMELETSRFRLRLAREGEGWSQEWMAPASADSAAKPEIVISQTTTDQDDDILTIRSPLPGTFYKAPQPGAAPFVNVGDVIEPATEVAIVETMKLMTTVSAGISGTVVEIVYPDATPIEANAILIKVKPL
jgi:acetyl-CoA carboxylase biotin carboxyl carrier protein